MRKKLGLPVDKFTIIGVGQIQERKGVLDFIKLAQLLPDFYLCGQADFLWKNLLMAIVN
uniref:CAZy families GT4 protein n=1 Tax=uncultured Listeria sp. TaxID=592375 RepID=A0A060CER8_9LIST|nr:CAZy families GT4 protein [uncultured Listeria sp.]